MERPYCGTCFVIHPDTPVPLSTGGGCLCCQADHKPMCDCGQPGEVGADSFSSEINNDDEPCVQCAACDHERAMDI